MDSFGLRAPSFASNVEVFEVDHPASQRLKLDRLRDRGIEPSLPVHYVAADLGEESLDGALARSAFDPSRASFFSWLGVTAYLTREANLSTLAAIARCGATGSELVFSYHDQQAFDSPDEERRRVVAAVAAIGEPWVSGFHPSELAEDLSSVGLTLVENLGREELHERYCSDRDDGLSVSVVDHIAHAKVDG
jgi:methyltransferase (TIGR00027 family)